MIKNIQVDEEYHEMARELISGKLGLYSLKDVVETAIVFFKKHREESA